VIESAVKLHQGLIIANLGDFDTLYGHRNDPAGLARALEEFDRRLPEVVETMSGNDLLILTADHGNDPVSSSTDHSREYVPLLCFSPSKRPGAALGVRSSFADVGRTVADYFGVEHALGGSSFLGEVIGS
jgi:phosphopentomutase